MLCDDAKMRVRLRGIVNRIARDGTAREDLLQTALIHLWLIEERRPGQTPSWYLQSCKYHLRNCLSVGRSIDSHKRRNGRVWFGDNHDGANGEPRESDAEVAVLETVSMRD